MQIIARRKAAICLLALTLGLMLVASTVGEAYAHRPVPLKPPIKCPPFCPPKKPPKPWPIGGPPKHCPPNCGGGGWGGNPNPINIGFWPYPSYPSYSPPDAAQVQLTVNANPSSLSGQVSGAGAYDQGSSASFSAGQNVIQVSDGTRYVFTGWTGDYTGTGLNASITMDSSKSVTAVYQLQYLLMVSAQPANAPAPSGGGWSNSGDTASLTAPSQTVDESQGSRLVFLGWSVDGNNRGTSSLSVQMDGPHAVVAQYKQQYYLTVRSDEGVPSGEEWYDAGTNAPISVPTPPDPSYGVSYVFKGWEGGVQSSSQSTDVMMDGPKTVTATWTTDSTVLYATIAGVVAAILVAAGVGLYSMSHRRRGTVAPTIQSSTTPPPNLTGQYCVNCGAAIPLGVMFCPKCGGKQLS